MIRFERILFPTDFSEASLKALPYAAELARLFEAELLFIHVVQPLPPIPGDYGFETEVIEYAAAMHATAERQLDRLIETRAGDLRTSKILVQGEPAETILRAVDEYGVDLITLATHGTTGWRHLLFGSVAEKVVRLAKVPVLTVSEKVVRVGRNPDEARSALASLS